jgi:hypothetical protein
MTRECLADTLRHHRLEIQKLQDRIEDFFDSMEEAIQDYILERNLKVDDFEITHEWPRPGPHHFCGPEEGSNA